jgi:hypothetical protein
VFRLGFAQPGILPRDWNILAVAAEPDTVAITANFNDGYLAMGIIATVPPGREFVC